MADNNKRLWKMIVGSLIFTVYICCIAIIIKCVISMLNYVVFMVDNGGY